MQKFTQKVKKIISSNAYLYAVIGLFIFSCLVFLVSINYSVPSDESYHYGFIEYYAGAQIERGPFISNQGPNYFELRDIQRIPNYFYHYLMSFVFRFVNIVHPTFTAQVFTLRFINIGISTVSILVILKILRKIKASKFMQHMVVTLMGLSGMILWVAASISYDPMATLLFLLAILLAITMVQAKKITISDLMLYAVIAIATVMTKITFAPFLVVLSLIILWLKRKNFWQVQQNLNFKKPLHVVLLAGFILMSLLFVERIGLNVVRYHQVEVKCDKVHLYEECMQDDVFRRNALTEQTYVVQKQSGQGVTYQPVAFTRMWASAMYERVHFYFGHQQMLAGDWAKRLAVVTASILLLLAVIVRKKIAESDGEKLLLAMTASYVAIMYIFNLQTYLHYGQPYAFQGRYLLPVVPFIYYFALKVVVLAYRISSDFWRHVLVATFMTIFVLSIYVHLPLLVFYRGSGSQWYSPMARGVSLRIKKYIPPVY